MREIKLSSTKKTDGTIEENEPVRVYDTSGPWGDKNFQGDYAEGLPRLRMAWIEERRHGQDIRQRDSAYG